MTCKRSPLLLACVAAGLGLPALAQTAPVAKPLTRAEVRKEAASANLAGKIEHGEADHDAGSAPPKPTLSTVKRADVRREAAAANKAGKIEYGEAGQEAARPLPKPVPSSLSRDEVRKEAAASLKAGKIEHGEADHDAGGQPAKVTLGKPKKNTVIKQDSPPKSGQTEQGEMTGPQKADEGVKPKK